MKRTALLLAALAALALAGCSSTPPPAPQADPRADIATAVATCATAIERIATTANGDAASKVAAVGAIERMCGQGGAAMHMASAPAPQPQSLGTTLWHAALQTADLVLRGYGIKTSRDVAITASNNTAATTIAGYNTFGTIAASGFASNAAIASHIQAPAGTSYSVSGNANFGAGNFNLATTTNTNSNNTTRTCTGGAAGNGAGTTNGGAGGPGGQAGC